MASEVAIKLERKDRKMSLPAEHHVFSIGEAVEDERITALSHPAICY